MLLLYGLTCPIKVDIDIDIVSLDEMIHKTKYDDKEIKCVESGQGTAHFQVGTLRTDLNGPTAWKPPKIYGKPF